MAVPERVPAGTVTARNAFQLESNGRKGLVAETGADGHTLAADGAAAAEYGCASLGFHTRPETVCFHAVAAIGLKCALGHGCALLLPLENLCLDGKIQVYRRLSQEASGKRSGREASAPEPGPGERSRAGKKARRGCPRR